MFNASSFADKMNQSVQQNLEMIYHTTSKTFNLASQWQWLMGSSQLSSLINNNQNVNRTTTKATQEKKYK